MPRLLLIDDDAYILEAMADFLRGHGHRVETARSAGEGIERANVFPFDAVI